MGFDMFHPINPTKTSQPDAADPTAARPEENFQPMVPLGIAKDEIHHSRLGKPYAIWPYYNIRDLLDGYVCRFETTNQDGTAGKEFRPYRYGALLRNGQTKVGWHWKGWGTGRPLYGLNELRARERRRPAVFPPLLGWTPIRWRGYRRAADFDRSGAHRNSESN